MHLRNVREQLQLLNKIGRLPRSPPSPPGDNLLIPCPAFALYQTLAESKGIEIKQYPLLPDYHWEADVNALEALIDARCACRQRRGDCEY